MQLYPQQDMIGACFEFGVFPNRKLTFCLHSEINPKIENEMACEMGSEMGGTVSRWFYDPMARRCSVSVFSGSGCDILKFFVDDALNVPKT